ncbi:MAG: 50S ribosomal protein L1 [Bacteroidales bacterium]|nr:50S ribosomal protein L1 [Bacteroidales bacterium]
MAAKLTKNRKNVIEKIDKERLYDLNEAVKIIKEVTTTKFDASIDLDVRLGVDPRKANQMVRGTITLPHGVGKEKKVLVLCTPDKEAEAKAAGADYAGLDDYIKQIQDGWLDFDAVVAMPQVMPQVGKVARVLGPRGLMPNPKTGTVTPNIADTVTEIKKGKVAFKVDKYGIIHLSVGRVSFTEDKLFDNISEFVTLVNKLKPTASKGTYVKSLYISSTMSPSIAVDAKSIKR